MKIRSHLLFLVLGTLLPILAFSAAMTAVFWREQRQALEQRFVDRVRGMTIALDREIDGNIRSLQMLAESPHLQSNDLLSFHEQIMRARSTQSTWANIILSDPVSGRQVINLRYPFGRPLPETFLTDDGVEKYEIEKFLAAVRKAMLRRDHVLSPAEEARLRELAAR